MIAGAGDDCAVLDLGVPGRFLLFKTDAVVEGIHFTSATPPEKIGHKALGRCLSDIAAMAGTPIAALVTIALPPGFKAGFVVDGIAEPRLPEAEKPKAGIRWHDMPDIPPIMVVRMKLS